jgi:small nuclear ribonucleoprotein (snRNP)-like protein
MTLSELKQFLDKTVTLRMTNGETAKVRVRVVDEEYDDLIVDVLETSTPERLPGSFGGAHFCSFGRRVC